MGELAQAAEAAQMANAQAQTGEELFKRILVERIPAMKKVMPSIVTPERLLQLGMDCYRRNPKLGECPPDSIVSALMTCSALGLEPSAVDGMGRAFIIPRWNKAAKRMEAAFQLGYAGAIELVMRSGKVLDIYAEVVHERDEFEFARGTDPYIRHVPYSGPDDPGPLTHAYCVAVLASGGVHSEVMTRQEIERRREVSKAKNGPWGEWYDEMAKKTVVLRATKYLPKSVEMQRAMDADAGVEPVVAVEEPVQVEYETGEVA